MWAELFPLGLDAQNPFGFWRAKSVYTLLCEPKYAYRILVGGVKSECERVLKDVADHYGYVVHSLHVDADHIHVFLSFKPTVCVSDVFHKLKGISARKLFQRFPRLRERYWGGHLWSRGKFFRSVGSTTDRAVKHYIEQSQEQWKTPKEERLKLDPRQTQITKYY